MTGLQPTSDKAGNNERFNLRLAKKSDCDKLCELLNEIIVIGGTTAFETEISASELDSIFISGDNCVRCFVAELDGLILGFQSLSLHPKLPAGWLDIATFARVTPTVKGVGSALFGITRAFVIASEYGHINATIRADNVPGLAYYSKMGFIDYSVSTEVPLKSGVLVDRISKKFAVPVKN